MLMLLYNWTCLLFWGTILGCTLFPILLDNQLIFLPQAKAFFVAISLLKLAQSLQVADLFLVCAGKTRGNPISSLLQFSGRIVVTLVFFGEQLNGQSVVGVLVPWSLAELIRYSYYLSKSSVTTFLRYNAFIVLYPVGIFGEMRLIQDFIAKYEPHGALLAFTRFTQGCILVGVVFLYLQMLRQRSKVSKKKTK